MMPFLWHCITSLEVSWKPGKCSLRWMRAVWKQPRFQTGLTRRSFPEEIHFNIHTWGLPFSSLLSTTRVLLDTGVDNLLSMPSLMKWDLSCLADRWPSCHGAGSARLPASLDTRRGDGAAPGHVSDPVASQSGGPRWRPRVVTALVSWCGVPLADKGEQLPRVTSVWEKKPLRSGCLWNNKMAAPVIRVPAPHPLSQGGPGPGEGIWAFSDCTHYLIWLSAFIMCIRSRFHKRFSCETRLVMRVNYSVVRGNIMVEEKIDLGKPGSRGSQNIKLFHKESTQPFYHSLCTHRKWAWLEFSKYQKYSFLSYKWPPVPTPHIPSPR